MNAANTADGSTVMLYCCWPCRNVLQTLKVVLHEGGVRGLWRGTGPTVVRLAIGAGINFVALENLKHFMLDVLPHGSGQLGYLQAAAVGGGCSSRRREGVGGWETEEFRTAGAAGVAVGGGCSSKRCECRGKGRDAAERWTYCLMA